MKQKIRLPNWNTDGFKTGLWNEPTINQTHGLLFLSNNTGISRIFEITKKQFDKLYDHKSFLHNFTK